MSRIPFSFQLEGAVTWVMAFGHVSLLEFVQVWPLRVVFAQVWFDVDDFLVCTVASLISATDAESSPERMEIDPEEGTLRIPFASHWGVKFVDSEASSKLCSESACLHSLTYRLCLRWFLLMKMRETDFFALSTTSSNGITYKLVRVWRLSLFTLWFCRIILAMSFWENPRSRSISWRSSRDNTISQSSR